MRAIVSLQLLGTPTESDLGFVRNEDARRYINQLPQHPRQPLARVFPHVNPLAIDLMEKMLTFDPAKRITGNFILPCQEHFVLSWKAKLYLLLILESRLM